MLFAPLIHPPHFAEEPLIRHWSEPRVWSWTGRRVSESPVIYQQGNCKEIERQTALKINLWDTEIHIFFMPLFICWCLCCSFSVCASSRGCSEMQVWAGQPHGALKDTHTHWPLDAQTAVLHKQTDGPCGWAEPRLTDGHTHTHTHPHVFVLYGNQQKDDGVVQHCRWLTHAVVVELGRDVFSACSSVSSQPCSLMPIT